MSTSAARVDPVTSRPAGPPRLAWWRLLPAFVHPYRAYQRLHERHGDTLSVDLPAGGRLWMTRAPGLIKRALVDHHDVLVRPPSVVEDIFSVMVGDNIVASEGARWRDKRARGERLLAESAAPPRLAALQRCATELLADVGAGTSERDVHELLPAIERYALTAAARVVSGDLTFGRDDPRFRPLGRALASIMRDTQRVADLRKRAFLFAVTPRLGARYEARRFRRLRAAVDVVARYEPDPLTRELLMAAYENPSTTLAWALTWLAQDGETLARARDEARACRLLDAPLSDAQLDRLRVADAVVRETIRLRPPIAYLAREARRDLTLGPVRARAGDQLLIVPWVVHTDARSWPDPHRFLPARFLDPHLAARAPLLSFGSGPRACVGARFALRILKLAIAALAARFDWTLAPGARPPTPSGRFPWSEKIDCRVRLTPITPRS